MFNPSVESNNIFPFLSRMQLVPDLERFLVDISFTSACISLVLCFGSNSSISVHVSFHHASFRSLHIPTSREPVEGKSSVCLISMKSRIIILIIIIISQGQILVSYIANTLRAHVRTRAGTHVRTRACTHARTPIHAHTHAHTLARTGPPTHRRHHPGCRCYTGSVRPTMTKICPHFACFAGREWPVVASLK